MNTWVLLERTEHVLPNLYRQVALPDVTLLFDSTELHAYGQQSPLLVRSDGSDLVSAIQEAPQQMAGADSAQ